MPMPSASELAAAGLELEDVVDLAPVRVLAENWETVTVWCSVWRQWRWIPLPMGARRAGLDWQQVESALRLNGLDAARWPKIFRGLEVMQEAALEVLGRSG